MLHYGAAFPVVRHAGVGVDIVVVVRIARGAFALMRRRRGGGGGLVTVVLVTAA